MSDSTTSAPRLMRLPEVMHRTGLKRALLYKLAAEGKFPKPLKIAGVGGKGGAAFWPENEVDQWINDLIAACRA